MFKKNLLLLLLITFVSCNAAKPLIVTSKSTPKKPKKELVRNQSKPKSVAISKKATALTSGSEIIQSTSRTLVTADLINQYVLNYKDIAMVNMRNFGIPASIILAQAILESGAGSGDLAVSANNHFGIKCYKDWIGETINHDDDLSQECFRKYGSAEESFKDHAAILTQRTRYASLFNLSKSDYTAWAKGLRAAGYATDPKYPEKLISYIERYDLQKYDGLVLGNDFVYIPKTVVSKPVIEKKNPTKLAMDSYEVQKGDTLYSISKKFNLLVDDLKQKNSLSDYSISIGQKLKVN